MAATNPATPDPAPGTNPGSAALDVCRLLLDKAAARNPNTNDFTVWKQCTADEIGEILTAARQALGLETNIHRIDGLSYPANIQVIPLPSLLEILQRMNPLHKFSLCGESIGWHDPKSPGWVTVLVTEHPYTKQPWLPWLYLKSHMQFGEDAWEKMKESAKCRRT